MIKVGLYLENKTIKDVDTRFPEQGNPGIGGTKFNFITMPHYFNKFYPVKVKFIWYANSIRYLPKNITSKKVENCLEALETANGDGCDMLIWRPTSDDYGKKFVEKSNKYNFKIIAWVHNTPFTLLRKISKNKNFVRFVCVSQEQLDNLRDHNIFYKSTVIFNGFDTNDYIPKNADKKEVVLYLGSLIPAKGFHKLAKVWPAIIKKHPSAKLYIIGTGKLYSRNKKLGKWGVADESYEKMFRHYLSDSKGNIDDSVKFLGLLGKEKIRYLQEALVGVANPTGKTENCPGSVIELQAAGTPVVSGAYWGLLDTVVHNKTGLLGKGNKELSNNIIYLLKNKEVADEYGRNGIEFVKEKFSHKTISGEWKKLFEDVYYGKKNEIKPIVQNKYYEFKFIKELLRLFKYHIPLFRFIPPIFRFRGGP